MARAVERCISHFGRQGLSNTAWAFARTSSSDDKLFTQLARAIIVESQLGEFTPQQLANSAWAFATMTYRNEKLFAAAASTRAAAGGWEGRRRQDAEHTDW
eukprot:gnl/TRDRNA2_/TRDRNA2_174464_c5_seq3.p2 gnl/TRDRNA2_/TRDRNA2_174464_c5~~gnl/TRDRNA2_/TRDRNA2_174464_c5_seq3.p2  ORF type:complete len:101 (-),score=10.69 gnl/TRDRNA2_/TRDRNA2_174464_c5_seq3:5-307(-)